MQRCAVPAVQKGTDELKMTNYLISRRSQQELHSTVQQQWPTLKRQYNTTIDLSDRLKAITGEVQSLEEDLDGDVSLCLACRRLSVRICQSVSNTFHVPQESALRPRLQASFTAHTQLAKRHKDSDALVELLHSLKTLQSSNAVVERCLADGRLDEVVPALQKCERLISVEIEDWKKECQPYKCMKVS